MLDFDAGKYALYVWPAFAATVIAFGWMVGDTLARARKWKRELDSLADRGDLRRDDP